MYKWRIVILLCGTNQALRCRYIGPEDNTTDVFNKLMAHTKPESFIGLEGATSKTNVLVRVSQIAAMDIRPWHDRLEEPDEMP